MNIGDGISVGQLIAKASEMFARDKKQKKLAKYLSNRLAKLKAVKLLIGAGVLGSAVFGASGAVIMSTLASAGVIVGGGVIAGICLVSGGAGVGTAKLLNDHIFKGDKDARIGSYSGAVGGAMGSLLTLIVVGAGPTGLAAIGSVFGGGMAIGAISLLATPIAGAALVGGAFYWRNKKEKAAPTESYSLLPSSLGLRLRRRH